MNKKHILYWFIGWAGLFVAVLYSPMGSPDLYSNSSAYVITQNVTFDHMAFTKKAYSPSALSDNGVQSGSVDALPSGQMSAIQSSSSRSRNYESASTPDNTNTGLSSRSASTGMSAGGTSVSNSKSSNGTSSSVVGGQSNAIAMNPEANDPLVKQSATSDAGGVLQPDLEGDNPGQMIPIGDNLIVLMILLGCYSLIKFRRLLRFS